VLNRNVPRVASIAMLPVPLFGSYTNLSSRTCDDDPRLRLLSSLNCKPAWPELPVLRVSFAWTTLPGESVPATLLDASGFTDWVVPILVWAFATVDAVAKSATRAEIQSRPYVLVIVVRDIVLPLRSDNRALFLINSANVVIPMPSDFRAVRKCGHLRGESHGYRESDTSQQRFHGLSSQFLVWWSWSASDAVQCCAKANSYPPSQS